MTDMATRTATAVLTLAALRRIAGVASAFGSTDRYQTPNIRMLVLDVTDGTVTAWASDSTRLARHEESVPLSGDGGRIGVDIAAFGKAVTAITKLAGGPKKGADVPVTVTGDDNGATLAIGNQTIAVPVAAWIGGNRGHLTATEWHANLVKVLTPYLPDGDRFRAPRGGVALAPDMLAALADAGHAIDAQGWQHLGNGDDPSRHPSIYFAAPKNGARVAALIMPVRLTV